MTQPVFVFSILLSIVVLSQASDWQGYGNMSSSNLTSIWEFINNNIGSVTSLGTSSAYEKFGEDFSNHLNQLWNPAWNIVTVKTVAQKDTVLYGYAFREHWMWYNGFKIGENVLNFVIWKDYNCQKWISLTQDSFLTEGDELNEVIPVFQGLTKNLGDVWGLAKQFINLLKTKPSFKDSSSRDYSMVLSQGDPKNTYLYSRFCYSKSFYMQQTFFPTSKTGKFLLFRTR